MDPLLWLYASITITIITAVLTLACLELGQFSGGKLRRLEDVNEKLAERLDAWFPRKTNGDTPAAWWCSSPLCC